MNNPAAPTGASQVYTWEPSNAAIAARYGLRPEDVLRFDTNTSPLPPPFVAEALAGPFEPTLNEYPDSSYEELTAAAAAYTGVGPHEVVVGAGADEILDLVAKAYLAAGSAALVPIPTYPMYGVLTSQRAARIVAVPRLGPHDGFALDVPAVIARLPEVVDCVALLAEQPDRCCRTHGKPEGHPRRRGRPAVVAADRGRRGLLRVRRHERHPLARAIRESARGAHRLEGVFPRGRAGRLRRRWSVGHRAPRARPSARLNLDRRRRTWPREHSARPSTRWPTSGPFPPSATGSPGSSPLTAGSPPRASRTFCSSVSAITRPPSAPLTRCSTAGIVPRTFGPANPLRGHLRLTVRTRADNERLLRVVAGIQRGREEISISEAM